MRRFKIALAAVVILLAVMGGSQVMASEKLIEARVEEGEALEPVLNAALLQASQLGKANDCIYTVKLAPGKYEMGSTLHIYGNTTLDLTGVTLEYTRETGNMLINCTDIFNSSNEAAGYGQDSNITIKGGTWVSPNYHTSCIMRISHCSNVTLKGCIFDGGAGAHQIEVCAIDGFTVDGCTFRNMYNKSATEAREALQLDIPINDEVFPGTYQDGTVLKRIKIINSTFDNVARGVGSHNVLVGAYFDNVQILNNTFNNIRGEAIQTADYKNCVIKNNTITNCGAGIVVRHHRNGDSAIYDTVMNGSVKCKGNTEHNLNTIVEGNTISLNNTGSPGEFVGIKVAGYKQEGNQLPDYDYYVSGVSVRNNSVNTTGFGIHLMDARDICIENNQIKGSNKAVAYDGISLHRGCENISITGNNVTNALRAGIAVKDASAVKIISNNKIVKSNEEAVYLGPGVSAKVSSNKLSQNAVNKYVLVENGQRLTCGNPQKVKSVSVKAKKQKLVIKWKKIKNATGYCLEYSTNSNFNKVKTKLVDNNNCTLTKLKSKNNYYIRIRAYIKLGDKIVYGSYSDAKSRKVK